MKKLTALLLMSMLLLCGCSAPELIDHQSFLQTMEEEGFVELKEFDDLPGHSQVVLDPENIVAEYLPWPSGRQALASFDTTVKSMEQQASLSSVSGSYSQEMDGYNRLQMEAGGYFMIAVRSQNNLVYMEGPSVYKDKIIGYMKQIGALS